MVQSCQQENLAVLCYSGIKAVVLRCAGKAFQKFRCGWLRVQTVHLPEPEPQADAQSQGIGQHPEAEYRREAYLNRQNRGQYRADHRERPIGGPQPGHHPARATRFHMAQTERERPAHQ